MVKRVIVVFLCMIINSLNAEKVLYDAIGKTYDSGRCADPEITQSLMKHLGVQSKGEYIDICCGSGNYTISMYNQGVNLSGIDISECMLEKARAKNNSMQWFQGDAHKLPFQDASFDGALCINAIHHLGDLNSAFKEIFRILKPGSRLVIFTCTKKQCEKSWIIHYFPYIWEVCKKYTSIMNEDSITELLMNSGFNAVSIEKFFVTPDTQDLFLYAGKYKPEIYLNEVIRDGMSPFKKEFIGDFSKDISKGLKELEDDIKSGKVTEIIAAHEKNLGESVFVIAEK